MQGSFTYSQNFTDMRVKISRTAFCEKCAEEERPHTGEFYAVKGKQGVHVHQVTYAHPRDNPKGFVPHMFELQSAEKGFVKVIKTCGMHDCGVDIRNNPAYDNDASKTPYLVYINQKEEIIMSVLNWNAMLLNPDLGYKLE